MEHTEAADDLTKAAKAYRRTERAHEEARQALKQAAVAALAAGVKQSEVVKTTGWTREYLRRLRKGEPSDGSAESAAPAKPKK
ncbi:hypothetical protein [Yinghuangia soli]|uniref:Uncharacterized protein n=1 Tax=Yinghuangia soli TaxID=2908204 RepID=A0AA41Q6R3_9ACTN|nr:hypothetical protein [Yinghuangia soli]MCF2532608.1 hypothetical protein [Yinghuangia soli]